MLNKWWGVISDLKQGKVPVVEVVIIHSVCVVDVHAGDFGISLTWKQNKALQIHPRAFISFIKGQFKC